MCLFLLVWWAGTRVRCRPLTRRSPGSGRRRYCRCRRWRRRLAWPRSVPITRNRHARNNVNRINAPALAGAACVAGHSPTQPPLRDPPGNVHHGRYEPTRVAAPSLTTCNRTTTIGADNAVVAAHLEAATSRKDVLECISTVNADLYHPTVETQVRILARRFNIEVMPQGQLWFKKRKV